LFFKLNSFVKSSAAHVCARQGLLLECGASLDPDARADQPGQAEALRRFAASPPIIQAAGERIAMMRRLVLDYAAQRQLADVSTGLVDIGWTGATAKPACSRILLPPLSPGTGGGGGPPRR
jgi:hypothetical protein